MTDIPDIFQQMRDSLTKIEQDLAYIGEVIDAAFVTVKGLDMSNLPPGVDPQTIEDEVKKREPPFVPCSLCGLTYAPDDMLQCQDCVAAGEEDTFVCCACYGTRNAPEYHITKCSHIDGKGGCCDRLICNECRTEHGGMCSKCEKEQK